MLDATPPKSISRTVLDPSVQRKFEKQARVITFRLVAEELLDKMQREGRAPATLAKTQWLLEFAFVVIGERPIGKITAPELLAVLRKIEARGNYETARRLRSTCGMVFRYAIAPGGPNVIRRSILRGALTTPTVKHRATILEPTAIGALLRAIDGLTGSRPREPRCASLRSSLSGQASCAMPSGRSLMLTRQNGSSRPRK